MDLTSIALGAWLSVGFYRLFEMFSIDAQNQKDGYNEAEDYGVSQAGYFFFSCVSAFGWPILMPIVYFMADDEDEDG